MLIPSGLNKQECYKNENSMPPYSLISKKDAKEMARHFEHDLKIYSSFDDSAETRINALYFKYDPKHKVDFDHGEGAVVFNSTGKKPTMWIRTPFKKSIVAPLYFHELGHCILVQRYRGQLEYYIRPVLGRIKHYRDIKEDWQESVAFAIGSCAALYWDIKNDSDYYLMSLPFLKYESKTRPLLLLRKVLSVLKNNESAIRQKLKAASDNMNIYDVYNTFFHEQIIRYASGLVKHPVGL